MLVLNRNILTIGGNRLEGGPLTPPGPPVDPYNPLGLPANTVRVRTSDGNAPIKVNGGGSSSTTSYETATLVTGTSDTYDVYKSGNDFYNLLYMSSNVVEVLGANTSGITNMRAMFRECTRLNNVALFDSSSATNMNYMLHNCTPLISVPLFDTSNAKYVIRMVSKCVNVQSGALALYQQLSSQANPPTQYSNAFADCGKNTITGSAELAQIPSSWGGTGG